MGRRGRSVGARTVGARSIRLLDRRVEPTRAVSQGGPAGADADAIPDLAEGDRIQFRGVFWTVKVVSPEVVVLTPAKGLDIEMPRKDMAGARIVSAQVERST